MEIRPVHHSRRGIAPMDSCAINPRRCCVDDNCLTPNAVGASVPVNVQPENSNCLQWELV